MTRHAQHFGHPLEQLRIERNQCQRPQRAHLWELCDTEGQSLKTAHVFAAIKLYGVLWKIMSLKNINYINIKTHMVINKCIVLFKLYHLCKPVLNCTLCSV